MLDVCSWNSPGHNAFMGDRPSAISSYAIPASVSAKLKTKMLGLQYDDVVEITKNGIEGKHAYNNMRNMHFGTGKICKTVDMSGWKQSDKEIGLVYCVEDSKSESFCIVVPTVCGNVSQIDRMPERQALKQFPVTTDASESFELQATIPPVAFFSSDEKKANGNYLQHSPGPSYSGLYSVPNVGLSLTWDRFYNPLPAPSYNPDIIITSIPEPRAYLLALFSMLAIGVFKWRNDRVCTLCGRVGHRAHACPWSKYK